MCLPGMGETMCVLMWESEGFGHHVELDDTLDDQLGDTLDVQGKSSDDKLGDTLDDQLDSYGHQQGKSQS